MRFSTAALLVAGLLAFAPIASAGQSAPPKTTSKAAAAPKSHEAAGVVKSVDANMLVITRGGAKGAPMTFDISPTATKEGALEVGSNVTVRYHEDGKKMVATDIAVKPAKSATTSTTKGKAK